MKKNPFNFETVVKSYQHHAFALGIILNGENSYNWLYNNYIQMAYSIVGGLGSFNFYMDFVMRQPILNRNYLDDEFLNYYNINKVDYIMNAVMFGKYVYLCVDDYHIPGRPSYGKRHNCHDLLINGYDKHNKEFSVIGYFGRKLSESTVKYNELEQSNPLFITLLSLNENASFQLNIAAIVLQLKQYINIIDNVVIGDVYYDDYKFGIEAIKELLNSYRKTMDDLKYCEINQACIYLEHNLLMKNRIEFIMKRYSYKLIDISLQYNVVVEKSELLKVLLLKYNARPQINTANKFLKLFQEIIELDENCMRKLVNRLEK